MLSTLAKYFALTFLCLVIVSCDALVGPDPANTAESNFELLWKEFDRDYPFFIYKGIDWDSLYAVYRPQVSRETSDEQLFKTVSSLLANLKDYHVGLTTPFGNLQYFGPGANSPTNFNIHDVRRWYLRDLSSDGPYLFGPAGDSLGYIYIGSFGNEDYEGIDDILAGFHSTKGLIIDIRDNLGGEAVNVDFILQRFIQTPALVGYVQYRSGPNHEDLTDLLPVTIDPAGVRYAKPIAVLTNRHSASASEWMTAAVQQLKRGTIIGDTTAGGAGSPIDRELPNGWTYSLPRGIFYAPNKQLCEGKGVPPDIPIWISKADSVANRDPILERAIDLLSR